MCGFVALLGTPSSTFTVETMQPALDRMQRRGPDGSGQWFEPGVWLGHRRLAIIDLDVRSEQPMLSGCGRYSIVFNGEIYNFRQLRADLESTGIEFRTTSDTEVLLALFAKHGEAMLPKLRGMFAFVIWDRDARRGFAARDPYGIKPLYFSQTADGVMLASQVKALVATNRISLAPCAVGQAGFWLLGSVPEPYTWYRDVSALAAGHFVWIKHGKVAVPTRWWDVTDAWRDSPETPLADAEIRERVRAALRESVEAHLVADVPVGVFLSGGIDSGALAGLMVEAGAQNLQAITIAYDEFAGTENDEAPVAATLAAHYGIKHHIRRVTREEFATDMPRILAAMDQPSIDGINTWYATKAVAELGLKVVVSGVGGDELFQGYSTFQTIPRLVSAWGKASRVPGAIPFARVVSRWQAQRSGKGRWNHLPDWARTVAGAWWLQRGMYSPMELPALMGPELAAEGLRGFSPVVWIAAMSGKLAVEGRLAVGQIESTTYLRNQVLRDADWASMDHSVELRTPLVDSWLLRDVGPLIGAFSRFPKKRLLAEAPVNPLPDVVTSRRKTGFGIPVQRWLNEMGRDAGLGPSFGGWAREIASNFAKDNP